MVQKLKSRNVVDFLGYRKTRDAGSAIAPAIAIRTCRHCGAFLDDGESEEECSSAGITVERVVRQRRPRKS
jgi:hypothetical protein